jgi:DNA-binding MarR family transcriptional regulator
MSTEQEFDERAWDLAKKQSLAQVILKLARRLDEEAVSRMREREGLSDLTPAHTRLFPHIDLDGTRATELAERLNISKQAISQLVSDLERMGVLERVPDPDDGRAKLVRFADLDSLFVGLGVLDDLADTAFETASEDELATVQEVLLRGLERLEDGEP